MANIFNRPMFRRGGSVAHGTGITSGLTNNRARYEDGTDDEGANANDIIEQNDISNATNFDIDAKKYDPNILKSAINVIRSELKPTAQESLADWLTAFGASGTGSIGEKQTLGGALSNTAKTIEAIDEKRKQLVDKYAGTAAVAALRGMSKSSQTALMKNAQAGVDAGYYKDINEGVAKQLQSQLFGKAESPEKAKRLIVNQYTQDFLRGDKDDQYARDKAEVEYMIRNEKKLPAGITADDFSSKKYINPNALIQENGKIVFNPAVVPKGNIKGYNADINKVFINPVNKKFYRYKGDSTFELLNP
jgi:hypothetical protein